jgi:hypothetical protein
MMKQKKPNNGVILSIMVGIFISKIFVPMLPYPKYRSIAYA